MSKPYFNEPFESLGYWWRPGAMDDAQPGRLRYDPVDGIRLTLLGSFEPPKRREFAPPPRYPLLLGRLTDTHISSFVTLTDCSYLGGQGIVFSIGTEELSVRRAYFGAHLETDDAFRFERAEVYLDYLEHWAVESTLGMTLELNEQDVPVRQEVTYSQQSTAPVDVGTRRIELAFFRQVPLELTRTVTISEMPYFFIEFTEPTDAATILRDTVFPLQNLSTLASDHPTRVTALHLLRGTGTDAVRVQVLYRQVPEPSPVPTRLYAEQMLFMTKDLPLDRILPAWLSFAVAHPDLLDLYYSVVYNRDLLPDARFFMLAQVAEGYHRDRIGGTETAPATYDAILAEVINAAPEQHRTWVKRKLRLANELSLPMRLSALVKRDKKTLKQLFGDTSAFVNRVVDTRNYMAHRTETLRAKAASGAALFQVSERLRFFVKACFLHEVGTTGAEQERLLLRHAILQTHITVPPTTKAKPRRVKT